MKSFLASVVALAASLTFSFAAVPDDVRGNLEKLVPETVRLLEAKDYAAVLETLVPPDAFKKKLAQGPLEEWAAEFGKKKAAKMLELLKALKDKKPKLSEDGNTATFDLPENPWLKKEIKFTKIEGRWFLNN